MNFSRSSATKCVSWNNETCMDRPTVIDFNPIEVSYYLFVISLDKYNGSCDAVDDLSAKYKNMCSK